jgi:hypothetical protein
MRTFAIAFLLGFSVAVGGCATAPAGRAANVCGDPCAMLSCPSAFVCMVDSHCAARCQPEGIKPGP